MRKIRVELSASGLKKIENELVKYQNKLQRKIKRLIQKLADIGIGVVRTRISESPLGKYITVQSTVTEEAAGCKAILIATGEVFTHPKFPSYSTILGVEFGSGVHYNQKANPKAGELGYGVGTFPDQIHAFEDGWYYWDDDKQQWAYTHGVKATMPMISASVQMQEDIVKVAREVFR